MSNIRKKKVLVVILNIKKNILYIDIFNVRAVRNLHNSKH